MILFGIYKWHRKGLFSYFSAFLDWKSTVLNNCLHRFLNPMSTISLREKVWIILNLLYHALIYRHLNPITHGCLTSCFVRMPKFEEFLGGNYTISLHLFAGDKVLSNTLTRSSSTALVAMAMTCDLSCHTILQKSPTVSMRQPWVAIRWSPSFPFLSLPI